MSATRYSMVKGVVRPRITRRGLTKAKAQEAARELRDVHRWFTMTVMTDRQAVKTCQPTAEFFRP